MAIVAGVDVHRAQITFDALDQETGVKREAAGQRSPMRGTGRMGRGSYVASRDWTL